MVPDEMSDCVQNLVLTPMLNADPISDNDADA